ncbi:hypothetical protein ACJOV8_016165 [Formosa sp. 3Alg 14/1]|uniref:hypothetical protein n=1 Tax=Formosa sp. 3Alg 14/1 TaxID=3382190 RepID=UPI0039BE9C12
MKITLKSASFIYKIIKHPISAIVISCIIGYAYYLLSLKDKDPLYNITQPILIADNINDANIKINWKDTSINNIHQIKLSIWNNGSDIVDYSDFVKNKPLTLFNEGNVKILKVSSIKSSRPNIKFTSKILNDSIIFSLTNSEALEKGDGEKFSILYSKINEKKWTLSGRIKGSKDGFGIKEVKNPNSKSESYTNYITLILFLLIILRLGISIYKKGYIHFYNREIIFITTYLIIIYIVPYYLSDGELLEWMK